MTTARIQPREHIPTCRTRIRPINPWSGYRCLTRETDCPRCVALTESLEDARRRREAREAAD